MCQFTNVDYKPTPLPPVYAYRTHPLLPLRQALDPIVPHINGLDEFIKTAKTECHFPSEHGLTHEESASIYLCTMDWGESSLYRLLNETWWNFKSRSSSVKMTKQFLGPVSALFMIEAKNGKSISAYSKFPEENEVILGLGTRLRVVRNVLGHPSSNLVHLIELSDENGRDVSSSLARMIAVQSVKNATSK